MKNNFKYVYILIFTLIGLGSLYYLFYKANEYAKKHFVVKHIEVYGTYSKVQEEIKFSLKALLNVSISKVDLYKVKAKVLENPRIHTASVVRIYPNIIAVKVLEKKPLFIWQNNNDEFYVVNSENKIIRKAKLEEYKQLILIKGGNLPIEASNDIRFHIYGNDYLLNKISVIKYTGYRWDLLLDNGIKIKLPEEHIDYVVNHIVKIDKKYQILSRKIEYIDATVPKKLFIKPEK